MTYQMNETQPIMDQKLKTLFVAAILSFGLVACGDSSDQQSESSADDVAESESVMADGGDSAAMASGAQFSAGEVINGVAFGDLIMGDPNAPIEIIEYASLTCPHCAFFHNNILPDIKSRYVDTGIARLVFRNYVMNPYDLYASMIARCAGPERAFGMMNLFYNRQAQWANEDAVDNLAALARRAGMNRATFDTCLRNSDLQKNLVEMQAAAYEENGVDRTPTFFINGEMSLGATSVEEFAKLIEDER